MPGTSSRSTSGGDPAATLRPDPRLGVVDIAGELGLPKGTVHGLLRTLQQVGFIEQDADSGKYQLGAALLHMGSSYLDGNELRTRALNWSDSLATRTRESVRIGTLHEVKVLIVHHVFRPDDSLQTLEVGTLLPAHATGSAKSCWPTTRTSPANWPRQASEAIPKRRSPTRATRTGVGPRRGQGGGPTSAEPFPARCPTQLRSSIVAG